jgi:hypothetical protein
LVQEHHLSWCEAFIKWVNSLTGYWWWISTAAAAAKFNRTINTIVIVAAAGEMNCWIESAV